MLYARLLLFYIACNLINISIQYSKCLLSPISSIKYDIGRYNFKYLQTSNKNTKKFQLLLSSNRKERKNYQYEIQENNSNNDSSITSLPLDTLENVKYTKSIKNRTIQSSRHALDLLLSKDINKVEASMFIEAILIQDTSSSLEQQLSSKDCSDLLDAIIYWKLDNYALKVFKKIVMLEITILPLTMTKLLNLICSCGNFDDSIYLLDKSIALGYSPAIHHFTPILKSCGNAYRAKCVLQRMESSGLEINVISYTSAIKSCELNEDWRSALELLDFMKIVGIQPNEITYCSVITVAARAMKGDIALNLLKEMQFSGISPNQLCYGSALTACARSNMWNEVDTLLEDICKDGLQLQESVLNSVITVCRNVSIQGGHSSSLSGGYQSNAIPITSKWIGTKRIYNAQSGSVEYINITTAAAVDDTELTDSDGIVPPWERVMLLINNWSNKVVNATESLFTMAMDVLEGYGKSSHVIEIYRTLVKNGIKPTKSSLNFAMRACANELNAGDAIYILRDAQRLGYDSPSMYNMTMIICDYRHRHADAIRILLELIEQGGNNEMYSYSLNKSKLPPVWITRKIISNTLLALTANFSACFTEIKDGRLAASADIQPFVNDITNVLKHTVHERKLYLSPPSYPMANKLLLDCGDYVTLRSLLNHTLFMGDVNSTRLYDFAARSLTRIIPLRIGLSTILLLMGDLYDAQYFKLAANIFLLGLNRLGLPLSEMSAYRNNNIDEYNSHLYNLTEYKTLKENRKIIIDKARKNGKLLNKYFNSARKILGIEYFPQKSYRIAAHAYKYAAMPDLMLDVYRQALQDNRADKQLKNLVVYNLARSIDYWDSALEILSSMKEKPDLFMYTSGLIACETGRDWEQAIFLLDEIQKNGYNLSTVSVTSAIAACAAAGKADEAVQLLDLMSKNDISRNIWTFNSVIAACSKQGRWKDALNVFELMRSALTTSSEETNINNNNHNINNNNNNNNNNNKIKTSKLNDVNSNDKSIKNNIGNNKKEQVEENALVISDIKTSNTVTFNTLIEVLGEGKQEYLVDEIYKEAINQNIVEPFVNIHKGWIDLHSHSIHMSKAALRMTFELFLKFSTITTSNTTTSTATSSTTSTIDSSSNIDIAQRNIDIHAIDLLKKFEIYTKPFIELNNELNNNISNTKTKIEKSKDLIIIVGKGDKLLEAVQKMLLKEFNPSIVSYVSKINSGRIIIPIQNIENWIKIHKSMRG